MGKQPETLFKERVLRALADVPQTWCFKVHLLSVVGIPDIVGCHRGYFFAWELKKDSKSKPSKIQLYTLDKIKDSGGHTAIVHPGNLEAELLRLRSLYTAI